MPFTVFHQLSAFQVLFILKQMMEYGEEKPTTVKLRNEKPVGRSIPARTPPLGPFPVLCRPGLTSLVPSGRWYLLEDIQLL